jgi:hypothetical protein
MRGHRNFLDPEDVCVLEAGRASQARRRRLVSREDLSEPDFSP